MKVICNIENILNATNGKFYVYFTTIKTRRKCGRPAECILA